MRLLTPTVRPWLVTVLLVPGLPAAAGVECLFTSAVRADNAAAVEALLKDGCDPNLAPSPWRLPLHEAVGARKLKAARALLRAGADPDMEGQLPRIGGVGEAEAMKLLLDHGARLSARDEEGMTALHHAARSFEEVEDRPCTRRGRHGEAKECLRGDLKMLRLLLARGADPNAQDKFGMTPLHHAVASDLPDAVALLAGARGARLSLRDLNEETPLHLAVQEGQLDLVRALLDRGADPNPTGADHTPLHYASEPRMVRLLVQRGAKVAGKDSMGRTPLHGAAFEGGACERSATLGRALLAAGAPVKARDDAGATALHIAVWAGNAELVGVLLRKSASARDRDGHGLTPLHWFGALARPCLPVRPAYQETVSLLLKAGARLEDVDASGRTALWLAVTNGRGEVVALLLDAGAKPTAVGPRGATLLHLLAYRDDERGAERLLKRVDAPEALVQARDQDGRTALHWAAAHGAKGMVSFLLMRGAEADATDASGRTALDWAEVACEEETARVLLDAGARPATAAEACPRAPPFEVDEKLEAAAREYQPVTLAKMVREGVTLTSRDRQGRTPLLLVAKYSFLKEEVDLLLARAPDVNARDVAGRTALHLAAADSRADLARKLLDAGADVNAADHQGRTPLHGVIFANDVQRLVPLLIERGASLTARDRLGRTPLHAFSERHTGVHRTAEPLMCAGAEAQARDLFGWTPVDRAAIRGAPNPGPVRCSGEAGE